MVTFLVILLIIVSVALGLFVLIQNPKGGGLATGGAGSNMFGVQRTSDVLEKGTWVLLGLLVVLSLVLTISSKSGGATGTTLKIESQIEKTATPSIIGSGNSAPATPATTAPAKSGDSTKK